MSRGLALQIAEHEFVFGAQNSENSTNVEGHGACRMKKERTATRFCPVLFAHKVCNVSPVDGSSRPCIALSDFSGNS